MRKKFSRISIHLYLGIYLTIVMSLTVSLQRGTAQKDRLFSLVDFGDHGGDCRECLSTSGDVRDRKASCATLVNEICAELYVSSSSYGGQGQGCL